VVPSTNRTKIAFENVYCPFLLLDKKAYAAVPFEWSHGHMERTTKGTVVLGVETGIKTKGIETVRRDSVPLVARGLGRVLAALLEPGEESRAARLDAVRTYVRTEMLEPLHSATLSYYWFIQSKKLTASVETYARSGRPLAIHVEVVRKLAERYGPASPLVPRPGSRVQYVVTAPPPGAERARKSLHGEDPLVAWRAGTPLCIEHYESATFSALTRILAPILVPTVAATTAAKRDAIELAEVRAFVGPVSGGGTADAVRSASATSALGTYVGVVRRSVRCAGCRTKIAVDAALPSALCVACSPAAGERRRAVAAERARLWARCRACQHADAHVAVPEIEDLARAIDCESTWCPTLYERLANDRLRALVGPARLPASASASV
jgi:hypothetical protein